MRRLLLVVTLGALSFPAGASVPGPGNICPERIGCGLSGNSLPCQFRFRADGSLDHLIVRVTMRDCFDNIVPDCSTSATVQPAGALTFCSCCPTRQAGRTDVEGVIAFDFAHLGGRGSAEVCMTLHCGGDVGFCCHEFDFTSADLDGSCNQAPTPATGILDMGVWAGCLPPSPYCQTSDYNCDGTVGVLDLGVWAAGLVISCVGSCP